MKTTSAEDAAPIHVIGATCSSGEALCRSLICDGESIVAVVRNGEKWREKALAGDLRLADLDNRDPMEAALADAVRVVSCANARFIPMILSASPRARQFAFLGSTRKFTRWPDEHAKGVLAGERAFLTSGRAGVILHPTMIYGTTGEDNVQRLARILRRLPLAPLPGGGRALVQPIHEDDVTRCLRAALDVAWTDAQTMAIAGPEPVPYAEFVRAVASAAGVRAPAVVNVPLGLLMAGAGMAGLLPFLPRVKRAELRRLGEDKAFDIEAMRRVLNVQPIGLEEGLALTFAGRPDHGPTRQAS